MKKHKTLKVVSLFCGCGGTDLGLKGDFHFNNQFYSKNSYEIIYANDIDKKVCKIFEENFNLNPVIKDIRAISSDDIPDCDVITGGFPCQSFSVIAQNPKRLGINSDKGKLFFEMCRILKEKKPKCFVAENVKGILSANNRETFPLIIKEFEKCGYDVFYKLLNAADFGIPQKRERVFIIGFRKDLKIDFEFPTGTHKKSEYIPLKLFLDNQVEEKYYFSKRAVLGMLNSKKKMGKGRVQDITKPCNTVGAHLAKVSLNSTDPVLIDKGKYRRFTPREVARIQSFPENFKLNGSQSSLYRALGNAIPPVISWYIGKQIQNYLVG